MASADVETVRNAGWVEPVKFNYDVYNANPKDIAAGSAEAADQPSLPAWAANATKYEWSDEYGDVGPAHPELEKQLFNIEDRVTEGEERNM